MILLLLALAQAPSVEACLDASERAQVALRGGRYLAARDGFEVCVASSCPAVVRRDCRARLKATQNKLASAVVTVVDADGRELEARVQVDGRSYTNGDPLDPGEHRVKVTANGTTHEGALRLAEGQRDHAVEIVVAPPPLPPAIVAEPPPPDEGVDVPSIALTAASGLALVTFAVAGGLGVAEYNRVESSACGRLRACTSDDTRSAKTLFFVADVALIVGITTGAGALVSWLSEPEP